MVSTSVVESCSAQMLSHEKKAKESSKRKNSAGIAAAAFAASRATSPPEIDGGDDHSPALNDDDDPSLEHRRHVALFEHRVAAAALRGLLQGLQLWGGAAAELRRGSRPRGRRKTHSIIIKNGIHHSNPFCPARLTMSGTFIGKNQLVLRCAG